MVNDRIHTHTHTHIYNTYTFVCYVYSKFICEISQSRFDRILHFKNVKETSIWAFIYECLGVAQGGGVGEGAAKSHYEKDICVCISKQGRDRERGGREAEPFVAQQEIGPSKLGGS